MSMDNIRLKQEDKLGESVVLTDINPATNTQSIDDPVRGEKMDVTLDRIWQAINNKLSRVVNSVNGRTGVVVLTSDDVGLGAVDNVSFADIKSWVITEIENVFKHKHLRFYENFDGAIQAQNTNDRALAWSPFYCDEYGINDHRSVIGVFTWDDASSQLGISYRTINTIGYSDNSIIYRTAQTDYNPGEQDANYSNIPVGGIGVNIYKEEEPANQILYLENPQGSKAQSGLRIDHNKVGSRVYYEDTPYGTRDSQGRYPDISTGGYMLWRYGTTNERKGQAVQIFINGIQIPVTYINGTSSSGAEIQSADPFYIDTSWTEYRNIRENDIIIMRFDTFISSSDTNNVGSGTCLDFSRCQPSIGYVRRSSTEGIDFDIYFYDLAPNTNGYGIKTLNSHLNRTLTGGPQPEPDEQSPDDEEPRIPPLASTQIGVDLYETYDTPDGHISTNTANPVGDTINMSGINAAAAYESVGNLNDRSGKKPYRINTMWGLRLDAKSGMAVTTDGSLSIYPDYQILPTIDRLGRTPKYVPGKFYVKNNDETYTQIVRSQEPDFWQSRFSDYYTKDGDTTYTPVSGVPTVYSSVDPSTGFGSHTDHASGSRLSTNYSITESNDHMYDLNNPLLQPHGLNPVDGLSSTRSSISLNLRKISSSIYSEDGTISTGVVKRAGYQFHNLSGLKINPIVNERYLAIAGNPSGNINTWFRPVLREMGLVDFTNAYGEDMSDIKFTGGSTSGVSVNVGRFLEITPVQTFRSETYWDGGKVQVRIGDGLCEKITPIDITNFIKTGTVTGQNFTYDELEEEYAKHIDEFVFVDGDGAEYTATHDHVLLDEKPTQWDSEWYHYEYNIGTTENPDYVFLPYKNGVVESKAPISFDEVDSTYMGPYYQRMCKLVRYGIPAGYQPYLSLSAIREDIVRQTCMFEKVIWNRPTNRITIDTDPETLSFNEEGKLTVVGGVGGNITNIRFVDSSGVCADTYHGEEIPETEQIILGEGFLLNGSGIVFPEDMRLPNTSNVELSNRIANIFASGLTTLETCKFISLKGTDLNVIPPVIYNINWVYDHKAEIYEKLKAIQNSGDLYSYYNAYQEAATLQHSVISDTGTYQFGDATYNIGNTEYSRSKVRSYITGNVASIQRRIANIIRSIRVEMADNPSDAEKIEQYVADHYGIGTISSNDQLIEAMQTVSIYNPGEPITSTTFLPLDWLFGFFTNQIMIGNKYYSILEGVFNYTQVTNRPNGWNTGYASYFKSVNSEKKPVTSIDLAARYRPGLFYTRDSGTGVFTLVTSASATQSTIIDSYYFKNAFVLQTSEPVDWTDNWNKYYIVEDPIGDNCRFTHVNTATKPTWATNTYYTENASGDVVGYEKVTAAPAFASDERGAAAPDTIPTNPIICAPVWGEETYYSDDQGTALESMPDDWYINYANYWTRTGSEGDYTYSHVVGVHVAFRSYDGPYYSRSLVNS